MNLRFILFSLLVWSCFALPQTAQAQGAPADPASSPQESPVGWALEEPAAITHPKVTLKLVSTECDDINTIESALLHMEGILSVDIESKKGHLIIGYRSGKVTPEQMVDKIARKNGCLGRVTPEGGL